MKNKFIKREHPHLCPDKTCKMIWSNYNRKYFDEGGSFFCYGIMKKAHRFIDKKIEHINNINHCEYTPLKGMIRFFTNFEDLWDEISGIMIVMDKLQPLHCDICRKNVRRALTGIVVSKDGKKRCMKHYYLKFLNDPK